MGGQNILNRMTASIPHTNLMSDFISEICFILLPFKAGHLIKTLIQFIPEASNTLHLAVHIENDC
jgi:hypothetical protein